jgi:uncharacterized protein (DUF427 family)
MTTMRAATPRNPSRAGSRPGRPEGTEDDMGYDSTAASCGRPLKVLQIGPVRRRRPYYRTMKPIHSARIEPKPGQESVWDYPRPPRVDVVDARVTIELDGETIIDTLDVVRVVETSHPPVYYLPAEEFVPGVLQGAPGSSICEFKGVAGYLSVGRADSAAWFYADPLPGYESLRGRVAVYPGRMDRCTVSGEVVQAQEGDFYGGWITSAIVGPFKGAPGTWGW